MKISLAAPVYNESENIQEFIKRSAEILLKMSDDIEIVLVNDCSKDDSSQKIKSLTGKYPFLKLINLTKNSGQHIATAIALQNVSGDIVFTMDSDLQVDPELMEDFFMFSEINLEYDIISARRKMRSKGISRKIGSFLISYLLQLITKSKLKDIGSTFKLLKRNAVDKILANDILIQNLPILMMNLNLNVIEFPIEYKKYKGRRSHYSFNSLIFAIVLALLNFSTGGGTLIILVIFGILFSFSGLIAVISIIIWGMMNNSVLPTNFLIFSLILSILGVQFILMSMIVFKLERINKNLDFKKAINQRVEYDD